MYSMVFWDVVKLQRWARGEVHSKFIHCSVVPACPSILGVPFPRQLLDGCCRPFPTHGPRTSLWGTNAVRLFFHAILGLLVTVVQGATEQPEEAMAYEKHFWSKRLGLTLGSCAQTLNQGPQARPSSNALRKTATS